MLIRLLAAHGRYVTAECGMPDAPLTANRHEAGAWETFDETALGDGAVTWKADQGLFVSAQPDGRVVANRPTAGPWETLRPMPQADGTVAYLTAHGTFLTAEVGQPPVCPVTATRQMVGPWEQFTRQAAGHPQPEPIPPGVVRTDFLTAQNAHGQYLNSGEYPALNAGQQAEIRTVWTSLGYTALLMETDWPGDAHVPAFSWTKNPGPFLACLPSLVAVGIEAVPLIGLEGTGRAADAAYISQCREFARQCSAHGVTRAVIGLECEEWTDYPIYRALVAAVGPFFRELLTHFHGGILAHEEGPHDVHQFYAENQALTGLCYQFDKQAHAGRFLVPDTDLLAQIASARERLPIRIVLHAGEYASLVGQDRSRQAGDIAAGTGLVLGCWNGIGPMAVSLVDPFVPVPDAIPCDQITFVGLHRDVTHELRSWPVTATLFEAHVHGQTIDFPNTASGRWTLVNNGVMGNIWEIQQTGPASYDAQTWDYVSSFTVSKEWLGSGFPGGGPRWQMLSGPARVAFDGVRARTNIVRQT